MDFRFYLGSPSPAFLEREVLTGIRMFISRVQIGDRKKKYKPVADWALDSGAFTELLYNGKWTLTPRQYADICLRPRDNVGRMDFCVIQDWMCEKEIIEGGFISGRTAPGTGKTLLDHQKLTVESYFTLSQIEPDLKWLPVLRGFTEDEYFRCAEMYEDGGLSLKGRWVGVGSVCRRQGTDEIAQVLRNLSSLGACLHGFGVKTAGLAKAAKYLYSADSMAWSMGAWRDQIKMPQCVASGAKHRNCANCPEYAVHWLNNTVLPALRKGLSGQVTDLLVRPDSELFAGPSNGLANHSEVAAGSGELRRSGREATAEGRRPVDAGSGAAVGGGRPAGPEAVQGDVVQRLEAVGGDGDGDGLRRPAADSGGDGGL